MRFLQQRRRNVNCTSQSQRVKRSPKSGCFDLLPRELLHQIVNWLSPSSAAALTLCNHTLMHTLGTQHLLSISQCHAEIQGLATLEESTIFLRGLSRDLPAASNFYCYHCHKIHLLHLQKRSTVARQTRYVQDFWAPNSERPFNTVLNSLCQEGHTVYNGSLYSDANTRIIYHRQFFFEHIQLVMELHRRGFSHRSEAYLDRLSLKTKQVIRMTGDRHEGFRFFEPRIVNNRMIARSQSWIALPFHDEVNVEKQFRLPEFLYHTSVCVHLDLWKHENRLTEILRCKLERVRSHISSCIGCAENLLCPMCPTEIQVNVEPFTKKSEIEGIMLIVTSWRLLGDGISPFEKHWAHRLQERCEPWSWLEGAYIKKAFENHPGTKWDSMLSAGEAWKLIKRANSSGFRRGG